MVERYYRHMMAAIAAIASVAVIGLILSAGESNGVDAEKKLARAMEQEIAYQARVDFLDNLFKPVRELIAAGKEQIALLELNKILKDYPGEGHALALKAEILFSLEANAEAVSVIVEAVKREGDLVDTEGLLSKRSLIENIVEMGEQNLIPASVANPDNKSMQQVARKIYYLQSRLAGGCE